jgi:peptide/nickel transport system substrate-binding protein
MPREETLSTLFRALTDGRISRREFAARAGVFGLSAAGIAFAVNAAKPGAVAAQATPAAQPAGRPMVGMENTTRGEGGDLNILYWQAITHLSPHAASGAKDQDGAALVLEPLINFAPDSSLTPTLITEIPSLENGMLAADFQSVTYSLIPGVVWSDGEPFTARDVEFTWKWITTPAHAAITATSYSAVSNVEVVDDLHVKISFNAPNFAWWAPFSGSFNGTVYPGHLWNFDPASTEYDNTFRTKPTGTGPYVVESFTENDQVIYAANERYREPGKPFFARVNIKGGGDAVSAARAVMETGDYDYAANMQVEPEILANLEKGGKGYYIWTLSASEEAIYLNFSDPNTEIDGEKSSLKAPHPSLTDKAVRQAVASAIDRQTITDQLYGNGSLAATNRLVGLPAYDSQHSPFTYDPAAANKLLDDAGWVLDGDTRKKGDAELKWSYSTSTNAVRQKTQAVVKANLAEIGIDVDLKSIDAGIYFDSSPGNDQNYPHFYDDITMYTIGPYLPYPLDYMAIFYAGPDSQNVAQKSNDWSGRNIARYVNPEYDALWEEARDTLDAARVAELFVAMNDVLIDDAAIVPLVQRAGGRAVSKRIAPDNLGNSSFDSSFWNIANWRTV